VDELSPKQSQILKLLFKENQFCSRFLIGREFTALLDQNLSEYYPFPESLFEGVQYLDDVFRLEESQPVRALALVERESPFLLNRDLATVALVRQGDFSLERADTLSALICPDGSQPLVAIEAALSLSHWRNWSRPLSKWFDWKNFLDVLETGFTHPKYAAWCSCAYIWAFTQQGGKISGEDVEYRALVDSLRGHFSRPDIHLDAELRRACEIALNQWGQGLTLGDRLGV
jgi:hypothetical protein